MTAIPQPELGWGHTLSLERIAIYVQKGAVKTGDGTGESLGGHLACYQTKLQNVEGCSIVQGTKLSYLLGLRQALVMEGNAIEIESNFCSGLESLPRTDRDHMKMRGGGVAVLCALQP